MSSKPELLSDEALAEIAEMFPHAEYQPEVEEMPLCKFCNGAIDDHKANCVVPHVHALIQTVRALRAQLQTKATLVISDIAKENAALRKLIAALEYGGSEFKRLAESEIAALREQYESAVTDFAVEINALREQLAEAQHMNDTANRYQASARARIDDLESRLAQVEKSRDSAREMVTLITTAKKKVEDDLELALRPLVEPAIALEDEQP